MSDDRRRPVGRPVDLRPADPDEGEGAVGCRLSLDTASRSGLNQDFTALRDQISTIVNNAAFNGFNLVDGSTTQITALASADGSRRITVSGAEHEPLRHDRDGVDGRDASRPRPRPRPWWLTIQASLTNVNAALGEAVGRCEEVLDPGDFAQKLSDTLTAGIGNLVDANMAKESAQLQSLQVKQQLGVQALSIANQAPQTILSLFR